ncbi:MAG: Hsp20/alpha crystallin family protein, partial [Leptospiraceae bacterium]|nr:Hsp20/alpha crystallin family protein [Leptospiraceae bacterium]
GEFERHFRLPEKADSQQISASSEHGVLRIRIGKSAKAQPRRITVNH